MKLAKFKPDYAVSVGEIIREHVMAHPDYNGCTGLDEMAIWLWRRTGCDLGAIAILLKGKHRMRYHGIHYLAKPIGKVIGLSPDTLLRIDRDYWSRWGRFVRWCRRARNKMRKII